MSEDEAVGPLLERLAIVVGLRGAPAPGDAYELLEDALREAYRAGAESARRKDKAPRSVYEQLECQWDEP